MEQRARRWLVWSGIASALVLSVGTAGFFAFWYVVWPMPTKWIALHSPWTAPQIRALGIVHTWGTDLDTVHKGEGIFGRAIPERGADVERGFLECLRSRDPKTRWMAFYLLNLVPEMAKKDPKSCPGLSPALEAEIIRGLDDPDSAPRSVARSCVKLLPAAQSQPIFRRWLESGDADLRIRALGGLAKPGVTDLTPRLLECLRDPVLCLQAIRLLSRTCDPSAESAIIPFVQNPNPALSKAARDYLRSIGKEQPPPVQ
jgi:hypothetical protein